MTKRAKSNIQYKHFVPIIIQSTRNTRGKYCHSPEMTNWNFPGINLNTNDEKKLYLKNFFAIGRIPRHENAYYRNR